MKRFPELVAHLSTEYGATSQRDLARKLGYPEGDAQRKVHSWFSAERGSYSATIEVLDALGFITDEGRQWLGLADRQQRGGGVDPELEAAHAEVLQVTAEELERRSPPARGRSGQPRRRAG